MKQKMEDCTPLARNGSLPSVLPFFICSHLSHTEVLHVSLPELCQKTSLPFARSNYFIHSCSPLSVEESQTAFYFVLCHLMTVGSLIHSFFFIDSTPTRCLILGPGGNKEWDRIPPCCHSPCVLEGGGRHLCSKHLNNTTPFQPLFLIIWSL